MIIAYSFSGDRLEQIIYQCRTAYLVVTDLRLKILASYLFAQETSRDKISWVEVHFLVDYITISYITGRVYLSDLTSNDLNEEGFYYYSFRKPN